MEDVKLKLKIAGKNCSLGDGPEAKTNDLQERVEEFIRNIYNSEPSSTLKSASLEIKEENEAGSVPTKEFTIKIKQAICDVVPVKEINKERDELTNLVKQMQALANEVMTKLK